MDKNTIQYNYKNEITKCLTKVAKKTNNPNVCLKYIEKNFRPDDCISKSSDHITSNNQEFCFMLDKYSTSSFYIHRVKSVKDCLGDLSYNKASCRKIHKYFYNNIDFCNNFTEYGKKYNNIEEKILLNINNWNNFLDNINFLNSISTLNIEVRYLNKDGIYIYLRLKNKIWEINELKDLVNKYDYWDLDNIINWTFKVWFTINNNYELFYQDFILKDIKK